MRTNSFLCTTLLMALPLIASAQTASQPKDLAAVPALPPGVEVPSPTLPTPSEADAPNAPLTSAPALVAPKPLRETEGLDDTLTDLVNIKRRTVAGQATLENLTVDRDIQQVQQEMQLETGITAVPELIAITGNGVWTEAEFRIGTSTLIARANDWVTQDWQVIEMLNNGVVLKKRGEKTTRLMLFGNRGTPPVYATPMQMQMAPIQRTPR